MNKIYKVIWSKVKHQYVVVSELAHRDGKKSKGIGRSAAALLAVLALTAGIGIIPVQAVENVVVMPEEGNNTVSSTTGENIVVVGVDNFLSQVTGRDIWIAGSGNTYQLNSVNNRDVTITGHHNIVQQLDAGSNNITLYGNSNDAIYTHLEDVSLLGNNGTFAYLTDVTAVGQNLHLSNMSHSFVAGQNLDTSAGSSIIIGINTTDDDYIASGTNLTVVGVDNKVYGNNLANEPNTVVGYNNIVGTDAGDNTSDATQGNTVMGTSNFVDGDGHRNVVYGFENKIYGVVEGSDAGSGYNTIIGQENIIGQEGSSPVNNVVIMGDGSSVSKDGGIAVGNSSHVNNMSGVAIGTNTYVNGNTGRSVALGSNSEVNESDLINDDERGDEVNPGVGVISVGSTGQTKAGVFQRRIINVADGRIKPTSYDAINGSQLHDFEITGVDFTDGTLTITSKDKYAVENGYFDAEKHQKIFTEEGIASQSWVNEQIEANGGGSWNVTTNGNPDGQEITPINKNNTVDFSGAKYDETNSNIIVSQEQVKEKTEDGEVITGTNLKFDLNDKVVLGEDVLGEDETKQIVLDGAKGTVDIGSAISMNGTNGQAEFGDIKINNEIDAQGQTINTIVGLDNTVWDAEHQEQYAGSDRAATEAQLHDAVGYALDNAKSDWIVTTNGVNDGPDTTISKGNTVDFSGVKYDENNSNIIVSQEQVKEGETITGTNLKFALNDNIVLGNDKIALNGAPEGDAPLMNVDNKLVVEQDGTTTIAVNDGSVMGANTKVTIDASGVAFTGDNKGTTVIDGQKITAGGIVMNGEVSDDGVYRGTITGLTNTTLDDPTFATVGRAATEEQLKQAAAASTTTVTDGKNITVTSTVDEDDNHANYEVKLNDDIYLGDMMQGSGAYVNVLGSTAQIMLGKGSDTAIVIDGGTRTISGLSNLTWDPMNQTQYEGSDLAATESQLHDAFGYLNTKIDSIDITGDDNITVNKPEGTGSGSGSTGGETTGNGPKFEVGLNDDITLGTTDENGKVTNSGSLTIKDTSGNTITINQKDETGKGNGLVSGLTNTDWDWGKYEEGKYQTSNAATESQLHGAMEGTVQYDKVKDEDGNVTVDKSHITLNEGGTTITNVAAGKEDMDAVNYSQLKGVQQQVTNNSMAITNIGNKVGELDSRIDEVGAGAAALAALHPLDFDPDDKWDFAAGYGNYRGENAVAIGAFYRPNEDTMFSVGGTVGNGDNMVNAGVSFKLGQGNGVSTSRVAMAKEIKSMRDIVAKQDAQIQKLTAMVNALVGIQSEPDTTTMFPDVPENHWAYEAVEAMAKSGLVKGYPDGEFKGDRTMTRYEFAQIVYNAIQAGAEVDARLVEEFKPELEYFHIATVAKDKDGNPTIERVRAN